MNNEECFFATMVKGMKKSWLVFGWPLLEDKHAAGS
jgi:hypothetical protein